MLKKTFSLLLIFYYQLAGAQDNVLLCGYVFDKANNEALSLAALQVKNSQLGALTDDNGFFELPIPRVNLRDSIKVSFIGYLPTTISVLHYRQGDTLRIYLETSIATKQEAVITAVSAKGVLLDAIKNLKAGFYKDSIIETGFYRQFHKENGKYVRLIEADVSVAFNVKDPFVYGIHELVHVNKQRRSENYETNGDKHGDHFIDLLKENVFSYNKNTFLNPKRIDVFAPKFESEDTAGWIVKTEYKDSSSAKLERARIWIDKESHAITRIEIEKFPNPYYVKSRYAPDSRWKLLNETDVIKLDRYKGKFVVASLERTYNHDVLNRKTGVVDFVVEETFDLYFYRYDGDKVGAQMAQTKFNNFTSLYTSRFIYDDKFWNGNNMLRLYPLAAQIKTDLERTKPLDDQFRETGK